MTRTLDALMDSQIAHFVTQYIGVSKDLFVDPTTGKMIHPGEFGTYREQLLRHLLTMVLPNSFGVEQGFIINRHGRISRQCDVIIFDKFKTPNFCSLENQRFIPIESVAVVIEAKSILSKRLLVDAISHLVQIKEMRNEVVEEKISKTKDSKKRLKDQIGTFIFCEDYDSNEDTMLTNLQDILKVVSPFYAPNLLVNIKHGGMSYKDSRSMVWPFPKDAEDGGWIHNQLLPVQIFHNEGAKYNNVKLFLRYVSLICEKIITLQPDLTQYFSFPEIRTLT